MAFVAGFVDALGFIHLGGFFVSFMTGNSTRLAVGLSDRLPDALIPLGLVILFVGGVVLSTVFRHRFGWLSSNHVAFGIAVLLAAAALLSLLGFGRVAILLTPIAMGAMNTCFVRDGEVSVGVTYMTGTLVKFGQRLGTALAGGDRWGWTPYLLLWLGLMAGAICGALSYPIIGLQGLWLPALALFILGMVADFRNGVEKAA
ncbi:YoaK family protein [Mesorhizobium sp. KR1-2]|uniref:YoaK family protein n=1 Tax=Mesorhizobium sp. KR1-2 TaxID=3156609 RepID=UPI0032B526C6